MDWKNIVKRKEHEIKESAQHMSYTEEVISKVEDKQLLDKLAQYLSQSSLVSGKPDGEITKQRAKKKAKNLVESRDSKLKHITKKAVESGFIWNFQLDQPWHPLDYSSDEHLTTIPWQHKYAVLYTGRKPWEFYTKDYLSEAIEWPLSLEGVTINNPDELINGNSILKQGYIRPAIRSAKEAEKARNTDPWAIYFWARPDRCKGYAGSNSSDITPVLECTVPTKFLEVQDHPTNIGSRNQYFTEHNSPKGFFDKITGSEFYYTKTDDMPFRSNKEDKGYPVLPLDYVNGIWDASQINHPYFIPLTEFVDYLEDNFPERVPDELRLEAGAKPIKTYQRNTRTNKKSLKLANNLKQLEKYVNVLVSELKQVAKIIYILKKVEHPEGLSVYKERHQLFDNLLEHLAKYDGAIKRVDKESSFFDNSLNHREIEAYRIDTTLYQKIEEYEELEKNLEILRRELLNQSHKSEMTLEEAKSKTREMLEELPLIRISEPILMKMADKLSQGENEKKQFQKSAVKFEENL